MHDSADTPSVSIAYIGGGSLNWATKLMGDIAYDGTLAVDMRLYDINFAAAERNARLGRRIAEAGNGTPATYSAHKRIEDALTGADIVVISILPGTLEVMASDIALPERYGIKQSVGDTVGPGGFVRAMRSIPMLAEIARAIKECCPNAYVCNLTNPMSALTGTLFAVFPEMKGWGECHEVTKLRHIVAWLANKKAGSVKYTFRDVEVNVLGINHFTFVDRAVVGGVDMLPDYLEFARAHRQTGWRATPIDPDNEQQRYFLDHNKVKLDLACQFGIAAAAGDRHLAEFVPQSWYLDRNEEFAFGLTPVDFRMRERDEKRREAAELDAGGELPPITLSEEALVPEIKALVGRGAYVTNVNMPNRGQLQGFAEGTIVETNARFSAAGIQPLQSGRLPAALELIIKPHAERQTALVAAVLDERWDDLFPLFVSDPLVAPIGPAKARDLFREMVTATSEFLPDAVKRAS